MKVRHIKKIITVMVLSVFLLLLSMEAHAHTTCGDEDLARLLAPIALYPDSLLSQVLMAATYPSEIAEADRWLTSNAYLTGESLDAALRGKNWDVSVLSLCYYPKVLSMMNNNLDWTTELGNAFIYQQEDVMDTIQDLRSRARSEGNLPSTTEQKVIVKENIIRIEPANPYYVYVPVYDPFFVYGSWWYPSCPPYRVFYPGVSVIGARIVFSTGIHVGFGVIGWSVCDWPSRSIAIVNIDMTKRFNRHHHVYHSPRKVQWKPVPRKWAPRPLPSARTIIPYPPVKKEITVASPPRISAARTRPMPTRIEREPAPARTPDRTVFRYVKETAEQNTVRNPGRSDQRTGSGTPGVLTRTAVLKNISDNVRKSIEKPGPSATGTKKASPPAQVKDKQEMTPGESTSRSIGADGPPAGRAKATGNNIPGFISGSANSGGHSSRMSPASWGNPRSMDQTGRTSSGPSNRLHSR